MNQPVVFITGANGGIGQALCSGFKEEGWSVIASDLQKNNNSSVDIYITIDLALLCRDAAYLTGKCRELKMLIGNNGLDCLINNAAVQIVSSFETLTVDNWHKTFDINLTAPFLLSRELMLDLVRAKGGIVNIASIHAQLTKPLFTAYATSKAALVGLTRSMAIEIGDRVRVNAICPAAITTPMLESGFANNSDGLSLLASYHPSNCIGSTDDIVQAALFLGGSKSSFLNGTILGLDGGIASRLHDPD